MSDQRVARAFADLADTLVDRFDGIEFLHVLADHSVELLPVDAAGILLADSRGSLALVATASHLTRPLDDLLLHGDHGPPQECLHTGQTVRCRDLQAAQDRWPLFSSSAVELGFAAVDSVAMRLREDVIGSLNLFRTTPGELRPEAESLAQSFANVATISLSQVCASERHQVSGRLESALSDRIVIAQAKGVLTERLEVGVVDALSLMRTHARNTGQLLSEVASQVVERSQWVGGPTWIGEPRPHR